MKANAPTITETKEAIITRIPKAWVTNARRSPLTQAEVLRIVTAGEWEFREGKTQEFGAFLARRYPAHARAFRRAR